MSLRSQSMLGLKMWFSGRTEFLHESDPKLNPWCTYKQKEKEKIKEDKRKNSQMVITLVIYIIFVWFWAS